MTHGTFAHTRALRSVTPGPLGVGGSQWTQSTWRVSSSPSPPHSTSYSRRSSIGLGLLVAVAEIIRWRTRSETWDRLARFWTKVFALTFAVGVATGIVMEFQFGTNWSRYATFVGDIFGSPLAAEAIFAFFLESTFLGVLLWGRDRDELGAALVQP